MKEKLFTEEYLDKLETYPACNDLLKYLTLHIGKNFHDAVIMLSTHYGLEPEYQS